MTFRKVIHLADKNYLNIACGISPYIHIPQGLNSYIGRVRENASTDTSEVTCKRCLSSNFCKAKYNTEDSP